jgi:hypothetical protein
MGTLIQSGHGYVLSNRDGTRSVSIRGSWNLDDLVGHELSWTVLDDEGGVLAIRPRDTALLFQALDYAERQRTAGLVRARFIELHGPSAPGTSRLEMIADPEDQFEEVVRLARRKDDPEAWAALANGLRIAGLERPILSAMKEVGWEKFPPLIKEFPDGWPDRLHSWVEEQRQLAAHTKKTLNRRAYLSEDYGTVDD